MRESKTIEFKRDLSRSFLKTVSAYANFVSGDILFGVGDDGEVIGVGDTDSFCRDLENMINDSISPMPRFTLETRTRGGRDVVVLHVFHGKDKPYLYKGKAYRRSDTSDVEVDRIELNRLVLEGQNLSFEEMPSKNQALSFAALGRKFRERAHVENLDADVLKTLRLYSDSDGYNNAAAILADDNDLFGIDIVRFGSNADQILDRERVSGVSALRQLDEAMSMHRRYYQYERIEGATRNAHERVPEEAFREAVANALVHRAWDTPANIQISMDETRIKVASPGGLPPGISAEEYLTGHVSVLRNPILAGVFFRLDYVEIFGTGIGRIMAAYEGRDARPEFDISDNAITITLPVLGLPQELTADELRVLKGFNGNRILSRLEVQREQELSQAKAGRVLNSLIAKGKIVRELRGRATKYRLA